MVQDKLYFSLVAWVPKIPFMYLPNILRDFKYPSDRGILSFCNLLPVSNSVLSIVLIFLNISCRKVFQLLQSNKTCISFSILFLRRFLQIF